MFFDRYFRWRAITLSAFIVFFCFFFILFDRLLYVIHKCLVFVRACGRRIVPDVGVRQTAAQTSVRSENSIRTLCLFGTIFSFLLCVRECTYENVFPVVEMKGESE